jgi:tagatose-6-phosphate ketose/aldose isomerase
LGMTKLIVGEAVPSDLARGRDVVIECPGLAELGEYSAPVIEVVIAQLLGFFRCMREGLRPDSPSENGVINRVVQNFALHLPAEPSLGEDQ